MNGTYHAICVQCLSDLSHIEVYIHSDEVRNRKSELAIRNGKLCAKVINESCTCNHFGICKRDEEEEEINEKK